MHREVLRLCKAMREAGGRALLVGGWVRDRLLGRESKDYDVEVFGIEPDTLRAILKTFGRVNTVGEHFAVYKLVCRVAADDASQERQRLELDVSIPRRESKSGRGHRGFTIIGDPQMTVEEAALRRDFTINAILYDPLIDEFIDPYGGIPDLEQKRLRVVAAETFVEDSLRVLRAVQFAARFEMTIDAQTVALCRTIDLTDLPHERVWGEVEKLLLMAARPSLGLESASQLGVLDQLFPELRALADSHQHESLFGETANAKGQSDVAGGTPENDFAHTKRAIDEAAMLSGDLAAPRRIAVMMATLCHVLGDSQTISATDADAISGGGNDAANRETATASEQALAVMERLGLYTLDGYDVRAQVLALVREQNAPFQFYADRERTADGDFRRLARRVEIDLLYRVAKACALATSVRASSIDAAINNDSSSDDSLVKAADWFIARARRLSIEHGPPDPLLKGRHLIELGLAPGPQMGELLRQVYELQLDGKLTTLDEARVAARQLISAP